jgi:heme-degrading monooxygenase HmoA
MFARVSTFHGSAEQVRAAIGGPVPTEVAEMAGFKGAYALLNQQGDKAMLITLWESEEAMQASAARATRIRNQMVQDSGGTAPALVEMYEVLAQP